MHARAALVAASLALGTVAGGRLVARADDSPPTPSPRGPAPAGAPGSDVVPLRAIDPDALVTVQRLLAIRGLFGGPVDGRPSESLDGALRAFAVSQRLETPGQPGTVLARTLDQLGAGPEVAVRWGSTEPRAPELSAEECSRVNLALAARGYRDDGRAPSSVDAATVDALRRFQRDTGHPVQLGNFVARRWLFILGVATPESCPADGG